MFIPSEVEFLKELEQIDNENLKCKLKKVYYHILGSNKVDNINEIIEESFKGLFKREFSDEVNIPYPFLNTVIARVLFTALYFKDEKKYSINDIVNITGKSRQYIWQERDAGHLKGHKEGKRWVFMESDVKEYLKKRHNIEL